MASGLYCNRLKTNGGILVSETSPIPERSLNLPNAITLSRLLLSFVLFGLIQSSSHWRWAAGLFVFAVATDILDGYIARKYKLITQLGRILDPFVDKFITSGTFLFLLPHPLSGINPWMVVIVLGREMLVTSLRGFLEQRGADFSATASGKAKMFLQCVAATASLLSMDPQFAEWSLAGIAFTTVRDILLWSMVAVTVWSGCDYVTRAIQLLRKTG
jgi:CDP-diacylglycerol--glycerol-3-phosphate 3-phosphatidyltransferase